MFYSQSVIFNLLIDSKIYLITITKNNLIGSSFQLTHIYAYIYMRGKSFLGVNTVVGFVKIQI